MFNPLSSHLWARSSRAKTAFFAKVSLRNTREHQGSPLRRLGGVRFSMRSLVGSLDDGSRLRHYPLLGMTRMIVWHETKLITAHKPHF